MIPAEICDAAANNCRSTAYLGHFPSEVGWFVSVHASTPKSKRRHHHHLLLHENPFSPPAAAAAAAAVAQPPQPSMSACTVEISSMG